MAAKAIYSGSSTKTNASGHRNTHTFTLAHRHPRTTPRRIAAALDMDGRLKWGSERAPANETPYKKSKRHLQFFGHGLGPATPDRNKTAEISL